MFCVFLVVVGISSGALCGRFLVRIQQVSCRVSPGSSGFSHYVWIGFWRCRGNWFVAKDLVGEFVFGVSRFECDIILSIWNYQHCRESGSD